MLLGCIADDLTGATDLSLMLSREGLRTVQTTGLAGTGSRARQRRRLVVVALKSRTIPAARGGRAVARGRPSAAARRARSGLFFKYCSTFDSTDAGNIGPVAEALLASLGGDFTIACPAFPATGRLDLHGPSVRRRRAARRKPDEGPSADADARLRSAPRAAAPDAAAGRATSPSRTSRPGRTAIRAALRPRAAPPAAPIAIVDALDGRAICAPSAPPAPTCRWSPAARASPSACRPPIAPPGLIDASDAAAAAPSRRPAGRAVDPGRLLLGRDARPGRHAIAAGAAGLPARSAGASRTATPTRGRRARLARGQTGRPCRLDLFQRRSRRRARRAGAARARRGRPRWSRTLLAERRRAACPGAASRACSSRAAKPPARSSARSGVKALSIGPEIDPGVPWTRSRSAARRGAGAEVRQFRRAGFLPEGLGAAVGERA